MNISVAKPRRLRSDLRRDLRVFADHIELRVPRSSEIAESFPMASVVGAFISATAAHRIMLVLRNKGRLVEMALVANSAAAAKKAVIAVRKQLLAAVSS